MKAKFGIPLLAIFLMIGVGLVMAQEYSGVLVITPLPSGQAIVTYYTIGQDAVTVPLLGRNITAIQAFDSSGTPLPASDENGTLIVTASSSGESQIVVSYFTNLGWTNGGIVTYRIDSPIPFWINITNVQVVDLSTAPVVVNNSYWGFPAGEVNLSVIFKAPAFNASTTINATVTGTKTGTTTEAVTSTSTSKPNTNTASEVNGAPHTPASSTTRKSICGPASLVGLALVPLLLKRRH